jgi:hypothetical protein
VALLDLLNQVETWQAMAAEGPVVVHCEYVQACCGLIFFSDDALYIVMESEELVSFAH